MLRFFPGYRQFFPTFGKQLERKSAVLSVLSPTFWERTSSTKFGTFTLVHVVLSHITLRG